MNAILKKLIMTCLITAVALTPTLFGETAEEKGWRIMKAVDDLPTVQKSYSETVFNIYDAQHKLIFTKKARSASFSENYKDPETRLTKAISYFYAPADDKGNSALVLENPGDQDNDQWIYLKGLRKPKRIIGSDKSSSYMGSDFSNGDVSGADFDDYTYKWLGTEKVKFKNKVLETEKIEMTFKDPGKRDDYGYSKGISWIHPSTGLIFKGELYNLDKQLFKKAQLLSFTVKKNRDGKKVFMPTGLQMDNLLKGTKTVMLRKNIKVEKQVKKVKPSIFALDYLTRRWW